MQLTMNSEKSKNESKSSTLKWEVHRIGEVCKTGAGGTPLKSYKEYYEGGQIPWLLSGEVAQGEIFESKNFITQIGLENSSARIFPIDTVLVAMYGATAGQVGILRFEAATNQAVCGILPNKNFIPKFIYYAILSKKEELISKAAGNAQPNISQIKIKDTEIPVPPLSEQKRIVSIVDEAFEGIDRAIANTEKNLTNAHELFESYLNAVFTQKGDGWIEKKLGDICSIKHGFAFKGEFFTNDESKYILLTPGSFHESGGYREQGERTKYYVGEMPDGYILNSGDFLFAMTEQAVGLLGSSLIVPESDRFLHNQRLGLVQIVAGVAWHNDFFFHQFNTKNFRSAVQSSASGVKVRHTSPNKLGAISVFFPPTIAEQKAVADTLNELLAETQHLTVIYKQKLAALKELKQSILQKAFTGEFTADNANQTIKTTEEEICV